MKAGKTWWVALVLAAVAGYWLLCLREYVNARLATPAKADRERAASLDPSDAENPYWLGRDALFNEQDIPSAISYFREATRLNPHTPRYWLDLAVAYKAAGRSQESAAAIEQAREASPRQLDTLEEIAALDLSQGDTKQALQEYRLIIANDDNAVERSLDLAWRGTRNAGPILDEALPAEAHYYGEFLGYLVREKEAAAADSVWQRLVALGQTYPASQAMPYVDSLLAQDKPDQARLAWSQMAQLDPVIRRYGSPGNLIVNPGFEQELLNDGLDWHYAPAGTGVELALDPVQAHTGTQSLAMTIDATALPAGALYQPVPVEPGRHYQFSGWVRTEELLSAIGPTLEVEDAGTHEMLFRGPELSGSSDWRQITGEFTTGPETRLVRVEVGREQNDKRIRGRLWLDDIELQEVPKGSGQ